VVHLQHRISRLVLPAVGVVVHQAEVICLRRFWMRMNRVDIRVNHLKLLVLHWIGLFILPAVAAAIPVVAVVVALLLFLLLHLAQVGFDDLFNPQPLIDISFHIICFLLNMVVYLFFSYPYMFGGSSTNFLILALGHSSTIDNK
jgi:hypothetical protein